VSGSSICWAICKSALSSRQLTMPAPHQSGRMPFLPPNQQRQTTEGIRQSCNSPRQTVHTHRASVYKAAKLAVALKGCEGNCGPDSRYLQADCQEPGSAPEPYNRNRVWATCTFVYSTITSVFTDIIQVNMNELILPQCSSSACSKR